MTRKPALQPLLRKWQRALGIAHWDLTIRYVQKRDEPGETYVGRTEYDTIHVEAKIQILDPAVCHHDIEATVKHELLHIALADIVKNRAGVHEERFIERIVPLLRSK